MKILKILLFISILSIPSLLYWKWYDKAWFNWNKSSWTQTCSNWRVLLSNIAPNWSASRSASTGCIKTDNTAPTITFTVSWKTSTNTWENINISDEETPWVNYSEIKLNVNINDYQSWVNSSLIHYKINNWNLIYPNGNFELELIKEWVHTIVVTSKDKAIYSSFDWWDTLPNNNEKTIKIKIDRSAPVFTSWQEPSTNWLNIWPVIEFEISDQYEWANISTKTFSCPSKSNNSTYISPANDSGSITWYCIITNTQNCSLDQNHSPNIDYCDWECNEWYVKDGSECKLAFEDLNCNNSPTVTLPTKVYQYNTNNILEEFEDAEGLVYWSSPSSIINDWSFRSYYDTITNIYSPTIDNCGFTCWNWYHVENGSSSECINDAAVICCNKSPLSEIVDNWANIDCNDPNNVDEPQCAANELCWWESVKDVLGEWNLSQNVWKYNDWNDNFYNNPSNACWYQNITNSNGYTCNEKYYLTWTEEQDNLACVSVPIWSYSWQENPKHNCTNWPSNSYYTSNSNMNNCEWSCNNWYHIDWSICLSNSRDCDISNWTGTQNWSNWNWWTCNVVSCNDWYSQNWNICIYNTIQLDCDSLEYRYKECDTWNSWDIRTIELFNKRSGSACTLWTSFWKLDNNTMWVDKWCRATFTINY